MTIYTEYIQKAMDRVESILDRLSIEYMHKPSCIEITCPIHGSQKCGNAIIYLTPPFTFLCFSGNCHEDYGKSILGLIKGALKTADKPHEWQDIFNFIDGGHKVCPIAQIIRETPNLFKDESTKPDTCIPSKYYLSRGFKEESLRYFEVGDAYNFPFKHKAIIPIRYINGEYMGFSARSHYPCCPKCNYHHGKYETCISDNYDFKFMFKRWYHQKGLQKSKTLYGINFVKQTDKVAIVEGPSCVWKLHEHGITAVSTLGKDFSKDRYELLVKCGIKKILFIPDNDEAGLEFKNRFIKDYHDKFEIFLPHINKKDVSEMCDLDIKQYIVSRWDKI